MKRKKREQEGVTVSSSSSKACSKVGQHILYRTYPTASLCHLPVVSRVVKQVVKYVAEGPGLLNGSSIY